MFLFGQGHKREGCSGRKTAVSLRYVREGEAGAPSKTTHSVVLRGRNTRALLIMMWVPGDITGNAFGSWFLDEPCDNLIYLELADCQLTSVPKEMGRVIPNVRVLNLNHNFIGELDGLGGLRRLRKLSMIGSRLRNTREIVKVVRRMGELEMVDFR